MKKSELYYKTVFRRRDAISDALLGFFLSISSWPRLLLEVFLRKRMGERYFTFSGAIALAVILALLPLMYFQAYRYAYHGQISSILYERFFTWYAYLAAFLFMSYKRNEEIKRLPGTYDFAQFSLSAGFIHPRFRRIIFQGKLASPQAIETIFEPGLFFSIGFILLWMFGQPIGFVLVLCSIIYSLSYSAAYREGTNYMLDMIDQGIVNEELANSMIEGRDASETRGFSFRGRRPADPDARRRVAEMLNETEETVEAL